MAGELRPERQMQRWGGSLLVAVALVGCSDARVDVFALPTSDSGSSKRDRSVGDAGDDGSGSDAELPPVLGPGSVDWDSAETVALEPEPYEIVGRGARAIGSRCYVLDPDISERRHVKGWRIRDTSEVVRRVIAMRVDIGFGPSGRYDDDPEPGYPCANMDGLPPYGLFVASQAMPEMVTRPGIALPLSSDSQVLLIVDYDASRADSLPASVAVGVDLWLFEGREETEDELSTATNEFEDFEGGESGVVRTNTLSGLSGDLHGVVGVANDYATSIELELLRDGSAVPLRPIPDPSPATQRPYLFDGPIEVRDGDRVRVRCTYDMSSAGGTVPWGLPSDEEPRELCLGGFYLGSP